MVATYIIAAITNENLPLHNILEVYFSTRCLKKQTLLY